jgi:Ca2+-binding EF-hand superfamily protein
LDILFIKLKEMLMTSVQLSEEEVQELWEAFKEFDADNSGVISPQELGEVMRSLGQNPNEASLHEMIKEVDVDGSGGIDFEEFKTLLIAKQGNRKSRLKMAFSVFDEDNNGQITAQELQGVMSQFGLTDKELDEIVQEVDVDGDASIDFEEFCKLMQSQDQVSYKDLPIAPSCSLIPTSASREVNNDSTNATTTLTDLAAPSEINAEVANLKKLLFQHPQGETKRGTSRLQLQIGLFRLIQGAAYRCFRESFSANHETHLRVTDLPYRITDFVLFVKMAIALYKELGVVTQDCYPLLDAVVESIADEYTRLQERIENWQTLDKTPQMLAEEKAMLEARTFSATVKEKFAAGVEFAITMKKKRLRLRDIAEGVLAIHELNRLRQIDLGTEMARSLAGSEGDCKDYLDNWNRVILTNASEEIDGAMVSVAYWYEDFMPKLLAAFSVTTAADIDSNTVPDEAALNKWYECTQAVGEFDRYGSDVAESFAKCTPKQKLMLKQAWRLTHHYLNGVQKRRERQDSVRESGELSHYIAFIDVYLNRSYVKDAQMRISFPYYIGPAVWRFFHTIAEIVCTKTDAQQEVLIAYFRDFFKLFASMYPCPYCRHHLNVYVVQNKEVEMYPVEYLLLGCNPHIDEFQVSIDAKLSTVVDGRSLRLFLWKLHNTVSSSITRLEEWCQKDEKAFYTTRYWPNFESELARAKTLNHININTERIYRLYTMLKPASRLASVKATLRLLLNKGDMQSIKEVCHLAQDYIQELEEAIINGNFLQDTYYFDRDLADEAPYFTPDEEDFARSGVFVETC